LGVGGWGCVKLAAPGSAELADEGLEAWTRSLPEEDTEALVDSSAGDAIRWVPGEGWVEGSE